jgi:hypothetical protein
MPPRSWGKLICAEDDSLPDGETLATMAVMGAASLAMLTHMTHLGKKSTDLGTNTDTTSLRNRDNIRVTTPRTETGTLL